MIQNKDGCLSDISETCTDMRFLNRKSNCRWFNHTFPCWASWWMLWKFLFNKWKCWWEDMSERAHIVLLADRCHQSVQVPCSIWVSLWVGDRFSTSSRCTHNFLPDSIIIHYHLQAQTQWAFCFGCQSRAEVPRLTYDRASLKLPWSSVYSCKRGCCFFRIWNLCTLTMSQEWKPLKGKKNYNKKKKITTLSDYLRFSYTWF